VIPAPLASAKLGSLEILNARTRCGWSPCPFHIRRTEEALIPIALAIAGAVQWVASCCGAQLVSAMTRSTVSAGSGGMREGPVLSRVSPSTPSCMKRSCQRHTTVLPLPTALVMAVVPFAVSGQNNDPRPPHVFCGLLRSRMIDCQRTRSAGITVMEIPFAHHQPSHETKTFRNSFSDSSVRCGPLVIGASERVGAMRFRLEEGFRLDCDLMICQRRNRRTYYASPCI
jgi:hypothetical protein